MHGAGCRRHAPADRVMLQVTVTANAGRETIGFRTTNPQEGRFVEGTILVDEARAIAQLLTEAVEVAAPRRGFTKSIGD